MDENELYRMMGGESAADTCRRWFKRMDEDRNRLHEIGRKLSETGQVSPTDIGWMISAIAATTVVATFTLQVIYHGETGRPLDMMEAENPGGSPPPEE